MHIALTRQATKDLDRLRRAQPELCDRLLSKIESLADDPSAGKRLVGPFRGLWSLRVGDWRVVYEVGKTAVVVLTVNHRGDVYR